MARDKEVNVIVDAKNKSKGAFVEVKKDLKSLGDEANKGLSKFSKSFANADKVIFSFADKMKWMDKIAKRTFQGTAAAAGIYVGATLKDFAQLNDGISKVNTLYNQTSESQKKMYQDSIKMFRMLPTNFEKMTQGTYDTISAGADPKYATMMARKFGMAGVAGDADMDVVTKAAMGTMNAFKLEAKDLTKILDLQFMTVKDGITSYSELASSLGTGVLASAKGSGITLEELYGSIAMITKNAIPANIATTSLNQLFNKFTDTKAIKEFKKFGVEIQDAKKNTRPLIEILKDLNAQFDKKKMTSEQRKGYLKKLLGSDEAARAIMPLIGDLKEFQKILGDMDNSSGAMKDAFNDRLESMKTQMQLFWNNLKGLGVEQVYTLEPLLNSIMEPMLRRQRLELELVDLEDSIRLDPKKEKIYQQRIKEIEFELDNIDLTPVEQIRDALKESVTELEKLNPPLAKFLDTIGNFVLNFVGDEGKENREKAGNVVGTIIRVYGAKKLVDVVKWFNKNFKLPTNPSNGGSEVFNSTSGNGFNKTSSEINPHTSMFNGFAKDLRTGIYVPKEYEVGGERYKEFENKLLNIRENKKNKKTEKDNLNSNMNLYSLRDSNGFKLNSLGATNTKSKEQIDAAIKLMNTSIIDELLKLKNLENNISMRNQINVEAPKVDARVYIDGKNIPVQRIEIDYGKVEKHFETQSKRYGRPV